MYSRKNYIDVLFKSVEYKKYLSDEANKKMIAFLEEMKWPPSNLTIDRAIARLELPRTDGGSDRKDINERKRAAQAQFSQAIADAEAIELTKVELDEFVSLSQAELQRRYWAEDGDFFRVRYTKAARLFGFVIPQPPPVPAPIEEDPLPLDAKTYHSMPAQVVCRRLMSGDARFRRAVDKLIANGEI